MLLNRRTLTIAVLMFLASTPRAEEPLPACVIDFNKKSWDARELAEQGEYGKARALLAGYIRRYGKVRRAEYELKRARAGVKRLAKLDKLWKAARKSPTTAARAYIRELLQKTREFPSTPEERFRVFQLLQEHDEKFQALLAERFPMSIRVRWLDTGDLTEFERLFLDEIVLSSRKAKIPVLTGEGKWALIQELRFTLLSRGVMGSRMQSHKLGGHCRLRDAGGNLAASWLVSKTMLHIEPQSAREGAAKGLGIALLDQIVEWLLTA